jgi:hypothetical protein
VIVGVDGHATREGVEDQANATREGVQTQATRPREAIPPRDAIVPTSPITPAKPSPSFGAFVPRCTPAGRVSPPLRVSLRSPSASPASWCGGGDGHKGHSPAARRRAVAPRAVAAASGCSAPEPRPPWGQSRTQLRNELSRPRAAIGADHIAQITAAAVAMCRWRDCHGQVCRLTSRRARGEQDEHHALALTALHSVPQSLHCIALRRDA